MSFDNVLIMFAASEPAVPPSPDVLNYKKDCRFAPLVEGSRSVLTVDEQVWSFGKDGEHASLYCPSINDVDNMLKTVGGGVFLTGLVNNQFYYPLGSEGEKIELLAWKDLFVMYGFCNVRTLGFDIVDLWTGVSALSNIGYRRDDLMKLDSLGLQANEFGLISSLDASIRFAEFADSSAPEHAPFVSVSVLTFSTNLICVPPW